jgi:hypothetical protein
MKLNAIESALLCWALELTLAHTDSSTDIDRLEDLLARLSLQLPYAPYISAVDWHNSRL